MSPSSGVEYETKFYVRGYNFNDTDDGLSFRYKFGYRLDTDLPITWFYEGSRLLIILTKNTSVIPMLSIKTMYMHM